MGAVPDIKTRRWKRVEYERLVGQGMFQGERLELIDGLLVVREPQGTPHATAIRLAVEVLARVFGPGWLVCSQLPVALDDESEPEPDLSVVSGGPRDYRQAHPSRPVLVVEVALESLVIDRGYKASLYARAGIADYWIVNLVDGVLEVRREPVPLPGAPCGWTYAILEILRPGDSLSPRAAPSASIAVGDLLP